MSPKESLDSLVSNLTKVLTKTSWVQ
jgi:hypothetical protein